MVQRTLIDLGQTPIIKDLVERSAGDRVRLSGVESVQALTYNQVITRLDLILARLGIILPPDPDPDTGPVITSPAAINSDGTPQVGETLTGIDPVGNGPVVARRWIAGGSTVATAQTYAPIAAGPLRYEADLQGPDGTILTSGSDIVVLAAPMAGVASVDDTYPVYRSGQDYTFRISRTGPISDAASYLMRANGSTLYPPGSPASDWPNGIYATATASFAAGSLYAFATFTAPFAAQPE